MPIDPDDLVTGGALQGTVAASLLRRHAADAALPPGAHVGVFRIVREIGRGGMAIVYLAERADDEYRQQVALKWMQAAAAGDGGEALFRRERQALADLRHPHIARLIDGGRNGQGRPWFAMEYIDGEPLDRHCLTQALPLAQRLALFRQVCAAVAFAHARGVIHRDIKPSNVLVDTDGGAKLLDFGIAQLLGEEDRLALRACTPGFASPEQLRGETPTVASDIYQLGRMLATLLSADERESRAVTAHEATRVDAWLDSTTGTACDTTVPTGLPRDLTAILAKATALDPARRHPTAEALDEDIQAFLAHRPVSARPRTPAYLVARHIQRHPLATTLAALALAALLGMAAIFTVRLAEERDIAKAERDAAERARVRAEAINRFLNEDLLDAANPLRRAADDPDVTVRQALDAAEAKIDERFGAQPEAARRVLATLARLRYEFGEFDAALALYDRAAALPATDVADDIALRTERATVLISLQRPDQAQATLQALLDEARQALGADHVQTLKAEQRLLESRSGLNVDSGIVPLYEDLRRRATQALGPANEISGQLDLAIADHYRTTGRPELGANNARRAHDALRQALGEDHTSTLKALVMLGHAENALGRTDNAIANLRQAHALQRARFGADDGDALFMQNELGFVLANNERFAEAEPILAELVTLWGRRWGEDSAQIVPMLKNLAQVRTRQGRADAALPVIERARRVMLAAPGLPLWLHAIVYQTQAETLRELGRLDEAEAVLRIGLETCDRSDLPAGDLRRLNLLGSQARLRLARGDHATGMAEMDAVIAALRDQVDDHHPILRQMLRERAVLDHAPAE